MAFRGDTAGMLASLTILLLLAASGVPGASAAPAAPVGPTAPLEPGAHWRFDGLQGASGTPVFPTGATLVDLMGDPMPELVALQGDRPLVVDLAEGTASHIEIDPTGADVARPGSPPAWPGLAVGDLEADGVLDVVVLDPTGRLVRLEHRVDGPGSDNAQAPDAWRLRWDLPPTTVETLITENLGTLADMLGATEGPPVAQLEGPPTIVRPADADRSGTTGEAQVHVDLQDLDAPAVWNGSGSFQGILEPSDGHEAAAEQRIQTDVDGDGQPERIHWQADGTTRSVGDPRGPDTGVLTAIEGDSGETLWERPFSASVMPRTLPVADLGGATKATLVPHDRGGVPGLAVVDLADGTIRSWTALPDDGRTVHGVLLQELDGDGRLEAVVLWGQDEGPCDPCGPDGVAVYGTRATPEGLESGGYQVYTAGWEASSGGVDAQAYEDAVEAISKIPFLAILMMVGGGVAIIASLVLRLPPVE